MTLRDWFDVAVRIVGVVVLVYGLWDLMHAFLFYADYFRNPDMTFRFYMIAGWFSIFLGLVLIRAAGLIVNFAYAPEEPAAEDASSEDDARDSGRTEIPER
jgi:hypothetical protein